MRPAGLAPPAVLKLGAEDDISDPAMVVHKGVAAQSQRE